ncbi:MAG TPA: glutathione transferase GstA [Burkholderiales bacterium]|nr:glutathione transferase GstA [Burkholderiales bacterium]
MKLYFSPGACSLSPHIAAREAGIPVDLVKVDLKARKLEGGGDYARINGKGYVPALTLDDGTVLTEGPAIVQYLADRKPETGLAPANGTIERYRLQEWLNFLTSEIHKSFSPLFNPAAAEGWKQAARDNITRRFDWVAEQLGPNAYLVGERFTVADAYLFTLLNWCQWTGINLDRWPALKDYHARLAARPKVQEALRAEGLAK